MVPVSTARPCLLLKCLFRIHMTESVLCPETSTHPIHCSSTHWLYLIDTPPLPSPQLSKLASLLSCQPDAHRCSAWTAGGVLACSWLTVFISSAETSSTLINASPRTHFNDILITRHSGHATRGSKCERGCRADFWALQDPSKLH